MFAGNQVIYMAVKGRSFLDLTRTVPGVVPTGGIGIWVNGNRNNQNNLMVDGVTNINTGPNGGLGAHRRERLLRPLHRKRRGATALSEGFPINPSPS